MFSASKPFLAIWHYMFLLVAEKILVPICVISVIRLSLFVLSHNYLSMCSLGRNLYSSGRNTDSWRCIMGVGGSHQLPSICEQSSISVGIIGWRKSGCVSLLNDCGPHRHLTTKVVPFEILILKSVNKLKLDNFWPSYDPSKEACFFSFSEFAERNPVASGRVSLLNDCGPHRHLRIFFTKQKLFLLKSWF